MSDNDTTTTVELDRLDRGLLITGLVAFLAVLGAYVALTIAGRDPEGVVQMVVTLAAVFGLGTYQRATHKSQARKLDKITYQTNGILTAKIEAGTLAALERVLSERLDEPASSPAEGHTPRATEAANLLGRGRRGFPLDS